LFFKKLKGSPSVFMSQTFRSGFIGVVGRPNVGKSTLVNKLVGQKVSIESPVVQTTRHRVRGVLTQERGQLVFLDTPGFSKPIDKLGQYLVDEAEAGLGEADILMVVVDASVPVGPGDKWLVEQAQKTGKFILLVMNKSDLLKHQKKTEENRSYRTGYFALFQSYKPYKTIQVSAKTGKETQKIPEILLPKLPIGPAYYDDDAVTDQRLREMTAELIREKVLRLTQEEIPHSVAVAIDTFTEEPAITKIVATLFVNQASQKGIVIGAGGSLIKKIGTEARRDIETLLEKKVFLDLTVKVKANWRKNEGFLKTLGLAPPG
jgi:GTPase